MQSTNLIEKDLAALCRVSLELKPQILAQASIRSGEDSASPRKIPMLKTFSLFSFFKFRCYVLQFAKNRGTTTHFGTGFFQQRVPFLFSQIDSNHYLLRNSLDTALLKTLEILPAKF